MNKRHLSVTLYAAVFAFVFTVPAKASIIQFNLTGNAGEGLLPGNEVGPANSTGSGGEIGGGIVYDDATNILSIEIAWGSGNGFTDLAGDVTLSHIHGFAGPDANAGALYTLHTLPGFDVSATSGGFNGIVNINEADEANLLAGLTYINVHTPGFAGGEIRGQLVVDRTVVPLPAAVYLFASGLFGLAGLRLKRRNR